MLGEELMETSDKNNFKVMKRIFKNELNKHKDLIEKLELDIIMVGYCTYNITENGLEYVDPLSPEVLNHLNKK